jgi:hypothetical protein
LGEDPLSRYLDLFKIIIDNNLTDSK